MPAIKAQNHKAKWFKRTKYIEENNRQRKQVLQMSNYTKKIVNG